MEGETPGGIALESTTHIPIAQLSPELSASATRSIKAIVTLKWPYSSATGSVSFLLSEPDFRLRRTRGQVRVSFAGSSAKLVAASGIASGDEVVLSLEGVEWISGESTIVTPGRGVDFELRFTERVLLQFKQEDSQEVKKLDIDHPAPQEDAPTPARAPTPPEEDLSPVIISNGTPTPLRSSGFGIRIGDEWTSPAFMKRERASYGSMFEADYDPFAEEDGSVRGKGRKRTRLSSSWRYTSRSPTPEVEEPDDSMDTTPEPAPQAKPTMTDEGCQTLDFETSVGAADDVAQTLADFSRQAFNVGNIAYAKPHGTAPSDTPRSDAGVEIIARSPPVSQQNSTERQIEDTSREQLTLSSPRLRPVPSESLAIVSPLVTKATSLFPLQNGQHAFDEQQRAFGHPEFQSDSFVNESSVPVQEEEEDIYTASPVGRREEQSDATFPVFSEAAYTADNVALSNPDDLAQNYAPEDQYGHWQSAGAHLSNTVSPSRNVIYSESTLDDRFFAQSHVEQSFAHATAIPEMPQSLYPELDEQLLEHETQSNFPSHASVPYPDLASPIADVPVYQYPPQPSPMSRSQSAQSAVVDLAESDDEVDSNKPLEEPEDEDDLEGSFEGEEDESEVYEREEAAVGIQRPLHPQSGVVDAEGNDLVGSRISQREEEQYAEDESEEEEEEEFVHPQYDQQDYNNLPPDANSDFESEADGKVVYEDEFYDEDEERSYDEEEEEEYDEEEQPQAPSAPRGEPEVIDLLSSDDEDEPVKTTPVPASHMQDQSSDQAQAIVDNDSDAEEIDEEEGLEDEQAVPYAELSEIKTSIAPQILRSSSAAENASEQDASYEEDEDVAVQREGNGDNESVSQTERDQVNDAQSDFADFESEEEGQDITSKLLAQLDGQDDREEGQEPIAETIAQQVEKQSILDEGEQARTLEGGKDTNAMEVDSPTGPLPDVEPMEEQIPPPNPPPERPSLFSRMFNLDGANDEPHFGLAYPSLAGEKPVQSFSTSFQSVATVSESVPAKTNGQLPTPEDTQNSNLIKSADQSFNSAMEVPQTMSVPQQDPNEMEVDSAKETRASKVVEGSDQNHKSPPELSPEATEGQGVSEVVVLRKSEEIGDLGEVDHILRTSTTIKVEELVPAENILHTDEPLESAEPEQHVDVEEQEEVPSFDKSEVAEVASRIVQESCTIGLEGYQSEAEEVEDAKETSILTQEIVKLTVEKYEESESDDNGPEPEPALVDDSGNRYATPETLEPGFTLKSPRRSSRKPHPSSKAAALAKESAPVIIVDSSADQKAEPQDIVPASPLKSPIKAPMINKENLRPVTPVKSRGSVPTLKSGNEELSPMVVIDVHATPRGHDASIEFALETETPSPVKRNLRKTAQPDPPSPVQHNLRKAPTADAKLRLSRALRTELSEFTALKVLRYNMSKKLDILAIVTTTPPEPQRAQKGPRHYSITFNITDPSIAPSGVTEVQVFRPYKDALPVVEVGDGVLLRSFLVQSVKKGFALRSEDASSWAVFREGEVDIRGPHVEFGNAERGHMNEMREWFGKLDEAAMKKLERANGDKGKA